MHLYHAIGDLRTLTRFYELTKIRLNIMIAYNHLERICYDLAVKNRHMINRLSLDSGAYAVSRGRANIRLTEYLRFASHYHPLFDQWFCLDDDFSNPEHNYENQCFLEENLPQGVEKPIPVVHDPKKPLDEFSRYVNMGHDYIAIGSGQKRLAIKVLKQIQDTHPDVKIHMFGNFTRKMLTEIKPHSADSATWAHEAGFGNILYWHPEEKKEYKVHVGRQKEDKYSIPFNNFPDKTTLEAFLLQTFRFTQHDLKESAQSRQIVNMYFIHQLESHLNAQASSQEHSAAA